MKRTFILFCAGVLMSAFCVGFVACDEPNGPNEPDNTRTQKPSSEQEQPQEPKAEPEPNTYVTESYKIINQTESDVVIEFHSGEVMAIKPGEEREVQKWDMVYEPGIDYSRLMYTVDRAVMKIDGEVIPDFIWLYGYWNKVRDGGKDEYHYSLAYALAVTDELIETVKNLYKKHHPKSK